MDIKQTLRLPRVFVVLAFLNFIVGSTLGGLMANHMAWWPALASVHGELNPFGWLTMLIYGMTYVVLFLSLGLQLPKKWQGGLHAATAEGAVIIIIASLIWQVPLLYRLGLTLQTAVPFIFLINIMSMVVARKRARRLHSEAHAQGVTVPSTEPEVRGFANGWSPVEVIKLFGVVEDLKSTDTIAQRGTDVSLMVFLVGAVWMNAVSWLHMITWPYSAPEVPVLLIYYGWITGTVLSVALHLYPRLLGVRSIAKWYAQVGQIGWGIALVLMFFGAFWQPALVWGGRILGVAIAWQATLYLGTMKLRTLLRSAEDSMHRLNIALWGVAWLFALVLGISLFLGLQPEALIALHLLFLGWITTLVYSIGYRVFPLLLNRVPPRSAITTIQVVAALAGDILMPLGFFSLQHGVAHAMAVLALGGITATVGALVFLLQWLIPRKG